MPDTSATEATQLAYRLLQVGEGRGFSLSGGLATALGSVEGDGPALLAAAEEALDEALPGQVTSSSSLKGNPRVLVVDDDLAFAQALADSLTERGWEGHPCTSREDALQRVTDPDYCSVFVDLVLAGGTGIDVIRRAVACQPGRPVVLMSGYGVDRTTMKEVLALGPVLFMRKPLSVTELDSAIRTLRGRLTGATRRAAHRIDLVPS